MQGTLFFAFDVEPQRFPWSACEPKAVVGPRKASASFPRTLLEKQYFVVTVVIVSAYQPGATRPGAGGDFWFVREASLVNRQALSAAVGTSLVHTWTALF